MYTSVFMMLCNGACIGVELDQTSVRWQADYVLASSKGREKGKPLAVFFGPGADGWRQVARDEGLAANVVALLRTEYVAVHVDTRTPSGKAWAAQFEVPLGIGLVISDRGGGVQAFHHAGQLAGADLARYLHRYANGHIVGTTETVAQDRDVGQRPAVYRPSVNC